MDLDSVFTEDSKKKEITSPFHSRKAGAKKVSREREVWPHARTAMARARNGYYIGAIELDSGDFIIPLEPNKYKTDVSTLLEWFSIEIRPNPTGRRFLYLRNEPVEEEPGAVWIQLDQLFPFLGTTIKEKKGKVIGRIQFIELRGRPQKTIAVRDDTYRTAYVEIA